MLTVPNTVGEICSLVAPPLGKVDLIPNAIWNFLLLGATLAIPLYGRARRRKPDEPTSGEMCEGVVDGLVAFAVLRYFMQSVNTIQVMLGESIMGAFAQMLALENLLEHGQLLALLLLASTSTSLTATIASVMKFSHYLGYAAQFLPLGCRNLSIYRAIADCSGLCRAWPQSFCRNTTVVASCSYSL